MEQLLPLVMDLFSELFFLVATLTLAFIIGWLRKRTTVEQQQLIEIVVEKGIIFAQQVYWAANGDERFDRALAVIQAELEKKNIKIDQEQLTVLIESTLKRLKKEFGEEWDK